MMGDGDSMGLRRRVQVPVVLLLAVLVGCGGGKRGVRPSPAPEKATSPPPVPAAIAAQRVSYASPNLLLGDTSFELPSGQYASLPAGKPRPAGAWRRGRVRPQRIRTLAVHGHWALRVSPTRSTGHYAVHWPAVPLEPGKTYTLSAYLRGGDRATVRLDSGGRAGSASSQAIRPTRRWQRYHVTFEAPAGAEPGKDCRFRPAIVVSADSDPQSDRAVQDPWVEIDAVQLESAPSPSPYLPPCPIDYAAVTANRPIPGDPRAPDAPSGCLPPGEPLVIQAYVRNNASERVQLQLVWQLSELLSRRAQVRVLSVTLPPSHCQDVRLDFGPTEVGYYVLRTDVRGGSDLGLTDRLGLAVLESSPTTSPFVSPCLSHESPRRLVWRWRDLETMPGQDDFRGADRIVTAVLAAGAEPIVCLSGLQAESAPTWALQTDGGQDVDPRQFRQFVFRVADHFRGRVRYWLLPPAPGSRQHAWARVYRQAVKLADPEAKVVGPTLMPATPSPAAAILRFLADGGAEDVDVLSHSLWTLGGGPPDQEWVRLDRALEQVRQACEAAERADLPRWEVTPAWPRQTSADLAGRAVAIHRVALLLKKHEVARWLMPGVRETDGVVRSACPIETAACAAAAQRLGNATFRQVRRIAPGAVALLFDTPNGPFAAIVADGSMSDGKVPSVAVPPGVRAENLFGGALSDGVVPARLSLSVGVVYVCPLVPRADWLEELVSTAP